LVLHKIFIFADQKKGTKNLHFLNSIKKLFSFFLAFFAIKSFIKIHFLYCNNNFYSHSSFYLSLSLSVFGSLFFSMLINDHHQFISTFCLFIQSWERVTEVDDAVQKSSSCVWYSTLGWVGGLSSGFFEVRMGFWRAFWDYVVDFEVILPKFEVMLWNFRLWCKFWGYFTKFWGYVLDFEVMSMIFRLYYWNLRL